MKKFKTSDFAFLLCIYLMVAFFPFNLFEIREEIIKVIQIGLRVIYFIFLIVYLSKRNVLNNKKFNPLFSFILIPCFVVCFSNLIVGVFIGELKNDFSIETSDLFIDVIFCLLTALCEEIIFRIGGFEIFKNKKPFLRILFTSLIFGAAHLFNFFSSFNPLVFVQALYTFGIGLILGLMYEFGGNITLPVIFHFVFNLFNNDIFVKMYHITDDFKYYLINILIGVICGVYCLLIYMFVFRKKEVK